MGPWAQVRSLNPSVHGLALLSAGGWQVSACCGSLSDGEGLLKGLASGRNVPPPVGAEKLEQGRGESKPKGEHVAEGVAYPRGSEGLLAVCLAGEEDPGAPVHPRGRFHPLNPPANAHGWELQTSLAHGGQPGGIETEGFLFPPMIPLWP